MNMAMNKLAISSVPMKKAALSIRKLRRTAVYKVCGMKGASQMEDIATFAFTCEEMFNATRGMSLTGNVAERIETEK